MNVSLLIHKIPAVIRRVRKLAAIMIRGGVENDSPSRARLSPILQKDMIKAFTRIGFHPFILVRHGRAGRRNTVYPWCKSESDLPVFLAQVAELPAFAQTCLLRALELALRNEIYDAADLLFRWTKDDSAGPDERVHIGLPNAPVLNRVRAVLGFFDIYHYYTGYPAFSIDPQGRAAEKEVRLQMLREAFEAYVSARDNDALRARMIEALGLALSRAFGSLGNYDAATDVVSTALAERPYSFHLKAAQHALYVKQQGGVVPERLVKFIGEDNGYLKRFICPEPFTRFDIGPGGNVLVCCGHWLPTSIGNFLNSSVEDILNSGQAQDIRRSVTDGSYKYCNHLECRPMLREELPLREHVKDSPIRTALDRDDFRLNGAPSVMFALDRTCNLACPSCRVERVTEKLYDSDAVSNALAEKLYPLLRTVRTLDINPAGELFASKPSRKILEFINDDTCPHLRIDIISNATLFSEKEWNKFPGIHNKVRSVRISTDAACKETFEKLRRPANYEKFLENLRFLARLRASGRIEQLKFSFTYQLDNFREMREFVRFCESMNADYVIFERLQNLGTFSHEEYRDRAVHFPTHPAYAEFIEIARDPIFQATEIYNDFEYPGIEKLDPEEARSMVEGIGQRVTGV